MSDRHLIQLDISAINCHISLGNARLSRGRFAASADDEGSLSPDDVNSMTVRSGRNLGLVAVENEGGPEGTEGSLDLFSQGIRIGTLQWECPWDATSNSLSWTPHDIVNFSVDLVGGTVEYGHIGEVGLVCRGLNGTVEPDPEPIYRPDLNGQWFYQGEPKPVISMDGDSLSVDMSADRRPSAHGRFLNDEEIEVSFPDHATFRGTLVDGGDRIEWNNNTEWTRYP